MSPFPFLFVAAALGGLLTFPGATPEALARSHPRARTRATHRAVAHVPRIRAHSVLLVSFDGRRVIFQRHANEVRSIASLSKLMASLVVVEHGLKLDGVTTISSVDVKVASGGSRTRLLRGMKVRNRDLLHAALLASDNRSIPAMGRAVGLSPARLVAAMNARARSLGLTHTRFVDPVGINHGNVSTAYEVAKILRQAVLSPVLQKVMRTRVYDFHPIWPHHRSIHYYNTNALLHRLHYPIYGGKTGFNSKAGYCVASAMRLPGLGPVLAVVMGSTSKAQRFTDFYSLLRRLERKGIVRRLVRVAKRARPSARRRHVPRRARAHRRRLASRHARRDARAHHRRCRLASRHVRRDARAHHRRCRLASRHARRRARAHRRRRQAHRVVPARRSRSAGLYADSED